MKRTALTGRHPAVMQRRSTTAYLGAASPVLTVASAVPSPVQPLAAAASGLAALAGAISSLFGQTSRFTGTTYEGAEQARADAGALGAAAGSVAAARFLLSQHKTNTDAYAQSATAAAIQQATAANPAVMQQALATPLTAADEDTGDGQNVLQILYNYKVPFGDLYAGYSTNNGQPGSAAAMQLAAMLKALPPMTVTLPGVSLIPTTAPVSVSAVTITPATVASLATAAPTTVPTGATLSVSSIQNFAQQIANGSLALSSLGTLAPTDQALITAQAAAIKAGLVASTGGLTGFINNNKVLVYSGVALALGLVVAKAVQHRAPAAAAPRRARAT